MILLKALFSLKNLVVFLSRNLIYKPVKLLGKAFFYKLIIKLYSYYFTFSKKFGLLRNNTLLSIAKQKLVHVIVGILAIGLSFVNIIFPVKAQSVSTSASKTILESLISSEFGSLEEQELIEEFFDQEAAISSIEQKYLETLDTIKPQQLATTAEPPVEEQEYYSEILNPDTLAAITPDLIDEIGTDKKIEPRSGIVTHEVQSGETASTIARNYGISVSTVLWANDLSAYSLIKPGDKLAILPLTGVLHKVEKGDTLGSIAKKYGIDQAKLTSANGLQSDTLKISQQLIVPGAKKITYTAQKQQTYSGINIIGNIVGKIGKDKPKSAPSAGNRMSWPTSGHRITQYYHWGHHAIDVANKVGTPIYAADAGVISYAGWGSGYGNQIVINHGGGKQTRYAHLSSFYVKKGASVGKGEAIGAMGNTGWSTGPHLHFEVIINGGKYNPLNYVR